MNGTGNRISMEEARNIDMVEYLGTLGYHPRKIHGDDCWYFSPLRDEKVPSFKVNRRINRWYDHGIGKGGSVIDFLMMHKQCTVGEAVRILQRMDRTWTRAIPNVAKQRETKLESITSNDNHVKVLKELPITSLSLLRYFKKRRIPVALADKYCRELRYAIGDSVYYGIGFRNDAGGYEIRSPYMKISSSPKDISTFKTGSPETTVFEGFMDFLSFKALEDQWRVKPRDAVVLNSVAFFERARPFMERHERVRLYLDRDAAGEKCSKHALALNAKYVDESRLYEGYKDLNDWMMNIGHAQKTRWHIHQ